MDEGTEPVTVPVENEASSQHDNHSDEDEEEEEECRVCRGPAEEG